MYRAGLQGRNQTAYDAILKPWQRVRSPEEGPDPTYPQGTNKMWDDAPPWVWRFTQAWFAYAWNENKPNRSRALCERALAWIALGSDDDAKAKRCEVLQAVMRLAVGNRDPDAEEDESFTAMVAPPPWDWRAAMDAVHTLIEANGG